MTAIYHVPGAILTERDHEVPLDHAAPKGPKISVFTREVAAPDGTDRPYLVFLQGGPGFEAARPTSPPTGWMKRALRDFRTSGGPAVPHRSGLRSRAPPRPTRRRISATSGPTRSSATPS